ncbi:uncharacterized protein L969DRAFT_52924 [Mixia osmundae IAM 14324]|uniref:DNA/RNA-binding domain-containing protein n=1 Tax=Mixia osmundae (strain CBS 9802 / IAM 14324 / JCM 22182 / KY 12970) TaxID=764103 RepID=G7E4Y3_MIXOS|nr:uncharacterized protein L969DRAFT_52924 [Mixia osmundae IAM 14324]KEI37754.1 hypothetical protein L969DRAFT_52924 [Mixia osmundae IAM 14324]GAA97893.1 hypothetical protein E5Q_04573 [Mixia osmundae IAM 14324]
MDIRLATEQESSHQAGLAQSNASSERSRVAKEVKSLSGELRGLVKKKDPWHQDVEFLRKSLRKQCLILLFGTTSAGQPINSSSRWVDALNVLWADTSHAIIHLYRSRITALDRSAEANKTAGNSPKKPKPVQPAADSSAARRRLIHSFRAFLKTEETFWAELLARIVSRHDLKDARSSLIALDIPLGDWHAQPLESLGRGSTVGAGLGTRPAAANATGERARLAHAHAVQLCYKALICYGDLARYSQLYNSDGLKKPATSGSNGEAKREKNWSRGAECYEQARLLLPDNGNSSNQMAVLASYSSDMFSSAYYYYRALCVGQPFPTARQNLEVTFNKVLSSAANRKQAATKCDRFKHDAIAFQARLFFAKDVDALREADLALQTLLCSSLLDRELPSEVIIKVVVLAMSSLWDARMPDASKTAKVDVGSSSELVQTTALEHILRLAVSIMSIATGETMEGDLDGNAADPASATDLAQRITAVTRRLLPALRILHKWTMCHVDYLRSFVDSPSASDPLLDCLQQFWKAHASFYNALNATFALESLPASQTYHLEEDLDMMGFLPLKRGSREKTVALETHDLAGLKLAEPRQRPHPNEEQLMRISDLLTNSRLLARSPVSGTQFVGVTIQPRPLHDQLDEEIEEDPVELAMRAATGAFPDIGSETYLAMADDDDEDEVLFPPPSQVQSYRPQQQASNSSSFVLENPIDVTGRASTQPQTAADLLDQVLGGLTVPSAAPAVFAPQAPASPSKISMTRALPSSGFNAAPGAPTSALPLRGPNGSPRGSAAVSSASLFGRFSPFTSDQNGSSMAWPQQTPRDRCTPAAPCLMTLLDDLNLTPRPDHQLVQCMCAPTVVLAQCAPKRRPQMRYGL